MFLRVISVMSEVHPVQFERSTMEAALKTVAAERVISFFPSHHPVYFTHQINLADSIQTTNGGPNVAAICSCSYTGPVTARGN